MHLPGNGFQFLYILSKNMATEKLTRIPPLHPLVEGTFHVSIFSFAFSTVAIFFIKPDHPPKPTNLALQYRPQRRTVIPF